MGKSSRIKKFSWKLVLSKQKNNYLKRKPALNNKFNSLATRHDFATINLQADRKKVAKINNSLFNLKIIVFKSEKDHSFWLSNQISLLETP